MNGKRARLIRRYARATGKDANAIKKEWNGLPRTLPNGTKSGDDAAESKRRYGSAMTAVVAASDD